MTRIMDTGSRRTMLKAAALLPVAAASAAHAQAASPADLLSFARNTREPDLVLPLWPEGKMPGGPGPNITERVDDQTDNAGLRYRMRMGGHTATLRANIDNLFDKRYWKDAGQYLGDGYVHLGAPRTARLSLQYDF